MYVPNKKEKQRRLIIRFLSDIFKEENSYRN